MCLAAKPVLSKVKKKDSQGIEVLFGSDTNPLKIMHFIIHNCCEGECKYLLCKTIHSESGNVFKNLSSWFNISLYLLSSQIFTVTYIHIRFHMYVWLCMHISDVIWMFPRIGHFKERPGILTATSRTRVRWENHSLKCRLADNTWLSQMQQVCVWMCCGTVTPLQTAVGNAPFPSWRPWSQI